MNQPDDPANQGPQSVVNVRVRYSETDQMGTFYNSRPLEWFECGRSEHSRQLGDVPNPSPFPRERAG